MKVLVTGSYRPQEQGEYGFLPGRTEEFKKLARTLGGRLAANDDVLVLQWSTTNLKSQVGIKDGVYPAPTSHPYWQTADYHCLVGFLRFVGDQRSEPGDLPKVLIDVAGNFEEFATLKPFPHPDAVLRLDGSATYKAPNPNEPGPEPFVAADWVDLTPFIANGTVVIAERRAATTRAMRQKALQDLVGEVDAVVVIGGGKATEVAAATAAELGKLIPLTAYTDTPVFSDVENVAARGLRHLPGHLEPILRGDRSALALAKALPTHLNTLAFCEPGSRPLESIQTRERKRWDKRWQRALRPMAAPSYISRVVLLGTEWGSGRGGLSTINRQLALTLAELKYDVLVLLREFSPQEEVEAKSHGVRLRLVEEGPGTHNQLTLPHPESCLPDAWLPDVIIGHGRITGDAAERLHDHLNKLPLLIQVMHVVPNDIEHYKEDRNLEATQRAHKRAELERNLARNADLAVGIGPRISAFISSHIATDTKLGMFRLDPGFDPKDPASAPEGPTKSVLMAGRVEDYLLKGFDIAAAAMGKLAPKYPNLELTVLGAQEGHGDSLRTRILEDARYSQLNLHVIPFETDPVKLEHWYRRSVLVLMPSRAEGFGLIGHEAIVRGIPVLVTRRSGLAELLEEILPDEEADQHIVEVTAKLSEDGPVWAEAIGRKLRNPAAAYASAGALRTSLKTRHSWKDQVAEMIRRAYISRPNPPAST